MSRVRGKSHGHYESGGLMFDDRITTFLKVAELGSFTEAARALFMTQPGVTRQIKSLESELGVVLIDRTASPVMLTEAGRVATDHFRTIVEDERSLLDDLTPFTGKGREFVVCFGSDAINYERSMFSRLMREAIEIYGANVRAVPATGERSDLTRLLDGSIDLLMGSTERVARESGKVRCRPLFEAQFGVACSRDDSLATRGSVRLEDLDGRVIYLMDDNPQCQQWLLDDLQAHPDIKVERRRTPTLASALPMVELGLGVVFVAVSGGLSDKVRFLPYESSWRCTIGPCWAKARQTPHLLRLVDAIAKAYADPEQPWDQHMEHTED